MTPATSEPTPEPAAPEGSAPEPSAPEPMSPEPTMAPDDGLPPAIDGSRESMLEVLTSESYKDWVVDVDEPREQSSSVSPHGMVRVYANERLIASIAKGNGVEPDPDDPNLLVADISTAHDTGSMAVKEMYQDGELVGRAALVKLEGAQSEVAYYCEGDAGRCGTGEPPPNYGVGLAVGCGACHGGIVFTVNFPAP